MSYNDESDELTGERNFAIDGDEGEIEDPEGGDLIPLDIEEEIEDPDNKFK